MSTLGNVMTQQTAHIERESAVVAPPPASVQAPAAHIQKSEESAQAPAPTAEVRPPAPRTPTLHRWTVEEFEAGIESGFIAESDAVELLDGYITEKMSVNAPHAFVTKVTYDILLRATSSRDVSVNSQAPIKLSEYSRPEPDLYIAKGKMSTYRDRIPTADEVLWIGEVADTSINIDRISKLPMYVNAGIPEYWIIDINAAQIECNTGPQSNGTYETKLTYKKGDTIQHELLGEIIVAELFGD